VPGVDKNSQVFHSDMADQLGVDLAKMNEGKISILHPRFRHPEKQLLGNARHRDLGLWGNNEQGVGVVEYEALPSKKGYLTSANSVVRVASRDNQFLPQNFASSTGSGVLVGRPEEGLVLTNKHVVNDAVSLSIKTLDGKNFSSKIVGIDPTHDLALIRIDDAPAGAVFPVAKLSQSDVLSRSTRVVGLGHPLGLPGLVASPGQYRYFDRSLKVDVLELDSMNYGSSGGGIFNQDGSLVGLMTKRLEASNAKGATWNLAGGMPVKYIREFLAANGVTGS
jgi:S1-C subfamily serine protease